MRLCISVHHIPDDPRQVQGDPLPLEDISGRSGLDQLSHIRRVVIAGDHNDLGLGVVLDVLPDRLDRVKVLHPQVEQDDMRTVFLDQGVEILPTGAGSDQRHIGLFVEDIFDPLDYEVVVVDGYDSNFHFSHTQNQNKNNLRFLSI